MLLLNGSNDLEDSYKHVKNDLKSIPIENFVEAIFYEAAIDHY